MRKNIANCGPSDFHVAGPSFLFQRGLIILLQEEIISKTKQAKQAIFSLYFLIEKSKIHFYHNFFLMKGEFSFSFPPLQLLCISGA